MDVVNDQLVPVGDDQNAQGVDKPASIEVVED